MKTADAAEKKRKQYGRSERHRNSRVFLRPHGERRGISAIRRFLHRILHHCYPLNIIKSKHSLSSRDDDTTSRVPAQYHISPNISSVKGQLAIGNHHNRLCSIEEITSWLYLSSFGKVMITFALVYISFVTTFALFLYLLNLHYLNHMQRECMDGWDVISPGYVNYEITFSLSWTTFSTVGYGHVSPSINYRCFGLELLCSLEAFFGLLYLAFCGSIMFAKIVLIHSKARVSFSSIICLEYKTSSSPIEPKDDNQENRHTQDDSSKDDYPFLEFRIVNNDANDPKRSAIVDASINCVLISYHHDLEQNNNGPLFTTTASSYHNNREEESSSHPASESIQTEMISDANKLYHHDHMMNDNSSERLPPVTKKLFTCLHVEPNTHPFFARVWYVRHQLDLDSPMLKPHVKESMIANDGRWPSELSNYESIRNALVPFRHVIVTFSGTSMVTMEQVFALTSYSFDDIYIGWQFVRIFHSLLPSSAKEDEDSREGSESQSHNIDESCYYVDKSLIHDIIPQPGGGNEPIDS